MEIKDLSVGSVGEPVRELHERLRLHGFVVPESETARAFFGPGTRDTLGDFQRAKGIKDSCEVCDMTAVLLAAPPAVPPSTSDRPPTISGGDLLRRNELGGDATAHIGSPVSTVGGSKLRPVALSRPVILDEGALRTTALMQLAGDGRAREFVKVRLTETLYRLVGQYLQFAPPSLRDALAVKLEVIDVSAAKALTLRELGHKLLPGGRDSDPQLQKEYDAFLRALPDDVHIGELLHLDQPIDRNPFLTDTVRWSRRYDLLRLTSIRDDETIMSLLDAIDAMPAALDKVLREWGEKRGMSQSAVADVEATIRLAGLTGWNAALVRALREEGVRSPQDAVRFAQADWQRLLTSRAITPPHELGDGFSVEQYARQLTESFVLMFPTLVFSRRLASRAATLDDRDLTKLAAFLEHHPQATFNNGTLSGVSWETVRPEERRTLEEVAARVGGALASFRDLAPEAALNDRMLERATRIETIKGVADKLDAGVLNDLW